MRIDWMESAMYSGFWVNSRTKMPDTVCEMMNMTRQKAKAILTISFSPWRMRSMFLAP